MKLRHAAGSPFVRKVMVLAHEHGIVDRIELVPTAVSPVQANDGLAPENPLMKVPSLVTDDGQTLFDSPVICEYLDNLASGRKLFPAAGPARWTALRQQALGDGILDALILCRYETVRPEDKRWSGWTEGQMRKAHQGLAAVEREDLSGPHDRPHRDRLHGRLPRLPVPRRRLASAPSEARHLVRGFCRASGHEGDAAPGELSRFIL